jgi:hypothetical protein
MTKSIQDSVHGVIQISEELIRLIDTPEFQRLRRISQLGFTSLVYPGANHTRFEHSIGVYHIARKLADKIDVGESVKEEIAIAALLHDIAHAPFSHSSERIVKKYLRMGHERVEVFLKGSVIEDVLEEMGYSLRRISAHISGKSGFEIVSGDIDADRMDYLVRDSHYTGVAYGVFDISRLMKTVRFDDGKMIITEKGLRAAESLLISRFMMYPTVYYHHVCRIARKMYEKALENAIEEGFLRAEELTVMDDCEILSLLKNSGGYSKEMMDRILSRKLFKRAIYVNMDRVGLNVEKLSETRAEREIADMAGIDVKDVIVDIPQYEEVKEISATVEIDGKILTLEDCSPIVKSLKEAQKESWKLGVYTPEENLDRVGKAAVDFLGIKKTPKQKRLDEVLHFL